MHFEKKTNLNQPVSVSVIHDYFHKQPFKNCHHLTSVDFKLFLAKSAALAFSFDIQHI